MRIASARFSPRPEMYIVLRVLEEPQLKLQASPYILEAICSALISGVPR